MTDDEDEIYLVICRDHGVVETGIGDWYAAELVIDDHQETCDQRVVRLTEDRWEELKKAGLLRDEIAGSTPASPGP